jgi:hypothetical protein
MFCLKRHPTCRDPGRRCHDLLGTRVGRARQHLDDGPRAAEQPLIDPRAAALPIAIDVDVRGGIGEITIIAG